MKGERPELQSKLRTTWEISSEMELEYESIISPTVIPYKEFEDYKDTSSILSKYTDRGSGNLLPDPN